MNLVTIIFQIYYQIAKLEFLEDLFRHSNANQTTLEIQVGLNMISTLRQQLSKDTEDSLQIFLSDPPYDKLEKTVNILRNTIASSNSLLLQMSDGMNQLDTLWVKDKFLNIVGELTKNSTELERNLYSLSQNLIKDELFEVASEISMIEVKFAKSNVNECDPNEINALFRKLLGRCMGDYNQAQRLVDYELQKNQNIDQEEALQRAIIRLERDNL